MITYFFYKNFIFTLNQFYYSYQCLGSGQTIVDDWYISLFNLVFTAIPLCISAVTDSDINLWDKNKVKNYLPLLYKENRDTYKIFTFKNLILKLIKGLIISFIIYVAGCDNEILVKGKNKSIWYMSLKNYICILIVVSMNLLINTNFIAYILLISIGITTFFLFGIFLIMNHYGFYINFNSKATVAITFSAPQFYFATILVSLSNFILDYTTRFMELHFYNSISNRLILNKQLKERNNFYYYKETKLNNSKCHKNYITEISNDNNENEISNNNLMNKIS